MKVARGFEQGQECLAEPQWDDPQEQQNQHASNLDHLAPDPRASTSTQRRFKSKVEDARRTQSNLARITAGYLVGPEAITTAERIGIGGRTETAIVARLAYSLPRPNILLVGCRPLVPWRGRPEDCPVCRGSVRPTPGTEGDKGTYPYCLNCDSMGAILDTHAGIQRQATGRLGMLDVPEPSPAALSEIERRRFWNDSVEDAELDEVQAESPLPKGSVGRRLQTVRDWLQRIDQAPDFALSLPHDPGNDDHQVSQADQQPIGNI